jgi:hypothetical protein
MTCRTSLSNAATQLAMYLLTLGFIEVKSDTSLFIFYCDADMIYLLLYVNDIVLTASSTTLLQHTTSAPKREFAMKDLGHLHHFLGISVQYQTDELFLTQCQFTLDVLECTGMVECKPVSALVDMQAKVSAASGPPVADPTQFTSLTRALQYLTFTYSDIAYVVQQICLDMYDPREPHIAAMKHILRYL